MGRGAARGGDEEKGKMEMAIHNYIFTEEEAGDHRARKRKCNSLCQSKIMARPATCRHLERITVRRRRPYCLATAAYDDLAYMMAEF